MRTVGIGRRPKCRDNDYKHRRDSDSDLHVLGEKLQDKTKSVGKCIRKMVKLSNFVSLLV